MPPQKLPPLNDKFIGRTKDVHDIHTYLSQQYRTGVTPELVIHGQGGMGKTCLAIAYAHAHANDYPGGIYFVDCAASTFPEGIASLSLLVLPDKQDLHDHQNREFVALQVKNRIEADGKPHLFILDDIRGYDDWKQWRASGFLPTSQGHRIITTIDSNLPAAMPFRLREMSEQQGIELLASYREDVAKEENKHHAIFIINWLGGIPLYLTIIGVYMRRHQFLSWHSLVENLESAGLETIRGAEHAAPALPDLYSRRIDQVLDNLLSSLTAPERRAIEYAALIFTKKIPEYGLTTLLQYDATITLESLAANKDQAAQNVVNELVGAQLLLLQSDNPRVFSIHGILKQKIIELMANNSTYKQVILSRARLSLLVRFSSEELFPQNHVGFKQFEALHTIFQAMQENGYIINGTASYNFHVGLYHAMIKARELAGKLTGKVQLVYDVLTQTPTPAVLIETSGKEMAWALAEKYGGEIKLQINTDQTIMKYLVVIKIHL